MIRLNEKHDPNFLFETMKVIQFAGFAFMSAFAAGMDKKSKSKKMTMFQFFSVLVVNGMSGTLIGLLAMNYFDNMYSICAIAGMGGFLGSSAIYNLWNTFLEAKFGKKPDDKENKNDK